MNSTSLDAAVPVQVGHVNSLSVARYSSAAELGRAAAELVAGLVEEAVEARGEANLVLATGVSQQHFIAALLPAIQDWSTVNVFHQDEYVGMSSGHSASFRRWVADKVLANVEPKSWHPLNGDADSVPGEVADYDKALRMLRPDVCVIGIGENGHIAFNDPPADVTTTDLVHVVALDEACRQQQVNEGHFPTIADVPTSAISLTIAGILAARRVVAVVPEQRKALAVRCALQSPISPLCPASLLRTAAHATLFLDADSARLLDPDAVTTQ
jgi:glucosamine-6-phosphate deaminase